MKKQMTEDELLKSVIKADKAARTAYQFNPNSYTYEAMVTIMQVYEKLIAQKEPAPVS
jgi:hypothetical protein